MINTSGMYPTGDKVLVLAAEVQEKTQGGLIIPQQTKDKERVASQYGTLVAVGPAARTMNELEGVELGDTVIHARYAGVEHPGKDGRRYRIMRALDVVGKADGVFDPDLLKSPAPTPFA